MAVFEVVEGDIFLAACPETRSSQHRLSVHQHRCVPLPGRSRRAYRFGEFETNPAAVSGSGKNHLLLFFQNRCRILSGIAGSRTGRLKIVNGKAGHIVRLENSILAGGSVIAMVILIDLGHTAIWD